MYILICDDEPAVARQVEQLARQHLEQRGIPVQCAVCTRGEEVLARYDLAQYQLALLDVDLETMTGIALGRRLKQQNPELVLVYISAYLEFAPEGYTVRAFRYLLKRDMERMLPSCLDAVLAEHSRECRTLPIRQGRRETEVPLDQIYYLESDLRKINVYGETLHKPLCSYYGKLTDLPASLQEDGFLRVGRSFVVNMRYIRQISNYKVMLQNGVELGVSRNGYATIRGAYLEWKGQFGDELWVEDEAADAPGLHRAVGRVCPHPLGDAGQRQVETSLCLYGAGIVRDAGNFALDRFRLFQCRFHCVQRAVPAGDIGVFWRDHPPEADGLHGQRRGLPADGKYSHISLYLSRSGSACAGDPAAAGRSAHGSGDAHRGWHHGSDGKALGPEAGAGTAAAGSMPPSSACCLRWGSRWRCWCTCSLSRCSTSRWCRKRILSTVPHWSRSGRKP